MATPQLAQLDAAIAAAQHTLLTQRSPGGWWHGELSSSSLATATAVMALALGGRDEHRTYVAAGLRWLCAGRNADGGWGDTPISRSNVATTLLAWSALTVAPAGDEQARACAESAMQWLLRHAGGADGEHIVAALAGRYGSDRTFAAPILMMAALAGRLGPPADAWAAVPSLPFELAAMPHSLLKAMRLGVVSYALPALIAIGVARYAAIRPRCPLTRLVRRVARPRALRKLAAIQPASGGFLEAVPLTAFVAMALVSAGERAHPAVAGGLDFLAASMRPDGSWPIDTNLATWVTTLSVSALSAGADEPSALAADERAVLRGWLLAQQHNRVHPYTQSPPGGWAWTDLSGGVPDADDTPGALLALRALGNANGCRDAAAAGCGWLLGLQNRDGGVPTFCRGWGKLPFDRSACDLTAHCAAAMDAWRSDLPPKMRRRADEFVSRAVEFLARRQGADGSWLPLWFGNEHSAAEENPVYGTARVCIALARLAGRRPVEPMLAGGVEFLLSSQAVDGGWGGCGDAPPSIEETAVATEALARAACAGCAEPGVADAVGAGTGWLLEHTQGGRQFAAAPIGLYFARLWYYERLYPVTFALSALRWARRAIMAL